MMTLSEVKTNREVSNDTEQHRYNYTSGYFRDDFTKEVRRDRVHIIINFSQEHRPLIWEDENNVLNSIEGNSHCHEEQSTISVLDTLYSIITILEKNDCKDSGNNCYDNLDVGGLRQSENVQKVSLDQKTELIAPSGLLVIDISISDLCNVRCSE